MYSTLVLNIVASIKSNVANRQTDRQTDRYFIDRREVNPDLFVIEIIERYLHVYTTS